jgi:hypothetical protein
VQTEFQQVSDHQVVFTVDDPANINHIVVFMTGLTPFPDGMGGAGRLLFVYFYVPSIQLNWTSFPNQSLLNVHIQFFQGPF